MNGASVKDRIDRDHGVDVDEIEANVQSLLHSRVGDLHLLVCGEGLVLKGRAHTFYAKQVAQHEVMKATDLPILKNEIEVD
jgi:hypothetical protein